MGWVCGDLCPPWCTPTFLAPPAHCPSETQQAVEGAGDSSSAQVPVSQELLGAHRLAAGKGDQSSLV